MTFTRNPGRFAGLLYVLTSVVGFFAMGYVPDKLIVPGNSAATVNNIAVHEVLFRFGIAGQLVGQTAFIFVALALYKLLEGVNRRHASVMVILIVVSIPIAFVNELNSLAALALAACTAVPDSGPVHAGQQPAPVAAPIRVNPRAPVPGSCSPAGPNNASRMPPAESVTW